jgi:hypothetical protein
MKTNILGVQIGQASDGSSFTVIDNSMIVDIEATARKFGAIAFSEENAVGKEIVTVGVPSLVGKISYWEAEEIFNTFDEKDMKYFLLLIDKEAFDIAVDDALIITEMVKENYLKDDHQNPKNEAILRDIFGEDYRFITGHTAFQQYNMIRITGSSLYDLLEEELKKAGTDVIAASLFILSAGVENKIFGSSQVNFSPNSKFDMIEVQGYHINIQSPGIIQGGVNTTIDNSTLNSKRLYRVMTEAELKAV